MLSAPNSRSISLAKLKTGAQLEAQEHVGFMLYLSVAPQNTISYKFDRQSGRMFLLSVPQVMHVDARCSSPSCIPSGLCEMIPSLALCHCITRELRIVVVSAQIEDPSCSGISGKVFTCYYPQCGKRSYREDPKSWMSQIDIT